MLTIHDKIPTDMKYVKDNELYFAEVTLRKLNVDADALISLIDCGHYVDCMLYTDRLGRGVDIQHLSTGCKTALNVLYNPDVCFDTLECGYNVTDALFKMEAGNILLCSDIIFLSDTPSQVAWQGRGIADGIDSLSLMCKEAWPDEDY